MRLCKHLKLRCRLLLAFTLCAAIAAASVAVSIMTLNRVLENLRATTQSVGSNIDTQAQKNGFAIEARDIIAGINVGKDSWALQDLQVRLTKLQEGWSDTDGKAVVSIIQGDLLASRTKYLGAATELELARNEIKLAFSEIQKNRAATASARKRLAELMDRMRTELGGSGPAAESQPAGTDATAVSYRVGALIRDTLLAADVSEAELHTAAFTRLLQRDVTALVDALADVAKREKLTLTIAELQSLGQALLKEKKDRLEHQDSVGSAEERLGRAIGDMTSAEDLLAKSSARVLRQMNQLETTLQADATAMRNAAETSMLASGQLVNGRKLTQMILAGVAFAFAVAMGLIFSESLARSIYRAVELARAVREGNFSERLEVKSEDEIGQLTSSLNAMAETLGRNDEQIRASVGSLHMVLSRVTTASDQVATGSQHLADSSQSLSQGATQQAAALEQIASAATEIGAQTKANAEHAARANELAITCQGLAEEGNSQMRETVVAMSGIHTASERIGKIIKVIDDIAFQTNLLALNAAVEAARAGRHGKGFAVVAEEVRSLAGRSSAAARETAELIETSSERVDAGTGVAKQAARSLEAIVESTANVARLISEIAAASDEQAQGVAQISQGLEQIDGVTQQNMATAEQTAAASEELTGQAAALRELLVEFEDDDSQPKLGPGPDFPRHQLERPIPLLNNGNETHVPAQPGDRVVGPDDAVSLDDREFGKY